MTGDRSTLLQRWAARVVRREFSGVSDQVEGQGGLGLLEAINRTRTGLELRHEEQVQGVVVSRRGVPSVTVSDADLPDGRWVFDVLVHNLGRHPTFLEYSGYVQMLRRGRRDRTGVLEAINRGLFSNESLSGGPAASGESVGRLIVVRPSDFPSDDSLFVVEAYRRILGRDPDATGASDYLSALHHGVSRLEALESLASSEEASVRGREILILTGSEDESVIAMHHTIAALLEAIASLEYESYSRGSGNDGS